MQHVVSSQLEQNILHCCNYIKKIFGCAAVGNISDPVLIHKKMQGNHLQLHLGQFSYDIDV